MANQDPARRSGDAQRSRTVDAGDELLQLPHPVDWDAIEAEARRQGCTVVDVIYDRAARS